MLCRRCGRRPSDTSDGYCYKCKKMEVLLRKMELMGRRQRAVNRMLSGGIIND